jgi:hypothetical protein
MSRRFRSGRGVPSNETTPSHGAGHEASFSCGNADGVPVAVVLACSTAIGPGPTPSWGRGGHVAGKCLRKDLDLIDAPCAHAHDLGTICLRHSTRLSGRPLTFNTTCPSLLERRISGKRRFSTWMDAASTVTQAKGPTGAFTIKSTIMTRPPTTWSFSSVTVAVRGAQAGTGRRRSRLFHASLVGRAVAVKARPSNPGKTFGVAPTACAPRSGGADPFVSMGTVRVQRQAAPGESSRRQRTTRARSNLRYLRSL